MKTTFDELTPEISEAIKKAFLDSMDENYTLIFTDYNDHYNDDAKSIQDCLDQKSSLPIDDNQWQADSRYHGSLNQLEELKRKILKNSAYKVIHPFIMAWLAEEENESLVIDAIEEKDISDPVKEMIGRTKLRGRATLYSNYDCFPHNYDMNNTYYYDEYLKDVIDILCLNPAIVKKIFEENGINTSGKWPDKQKRNGKEAIIYKDLADELSNQCNYCLFTFMGLFPCVNLYENGFSEYRTIVIPKDNYCGMFNSWNGGGSLMGIKLIRDLYVPIRRPDKTEYGRSEICVDEPNCGRQYSINEVYGMNLSQWGKEFQLIYK